MVTEPKPVANQTNPRVGLERLIYWFSKIVDPLSTIGGYIGAAALAFMMFLTLFDVLGRLLGGISFIHRLTSFFKPINGALEISSYSMALLVVFGVGYMALAKGHIRVDLVLQYTSPKVTKWINLFTYAISSGFYILVTWQSWINATKVYKGQLSSPVLLIPTFPFVIIVVIGAAIVVLVFLRDFLKSIEELMR